MITGTIHPLELLEELEVVTVSVADGAFVPYSDLTELPSSAAADVVVLESSDVGVGVSAVTVEDLDEVVLTVATTDESVLLEPAEADALGVGDGVGGAVVAPASLPDTLPPLFSTGAAVVAVGFCVVFGDGDGVTDGEGDGDGAGDGTGDAGAGVIDVDVSELPVDVCASAAQDATTAATSSRRSERLSMDTMVRKSLVVPVK